MTERRKFIQKIAGLTAAFSGPSLMQQAWAADWEKVYQNMLKPAFIFDGRNLLERGTLEKIGFIYHGTGK